MHAHVDAAMVAAGDGAALELAARAQDQEVADIVGAVDRLGALLLGVAVGVEAMQRRQHHHRIQ